MHPLSYYENFEATVVVPLKIGDGLVVRLCGQTISSRMKSGEFPPGSTFILALLGELEVVCVGLGSNENLSPYGFVVERIIL